MDTLFFAIIGSVTASIISGLVFWFSRSVKKLYDTVHLQSISANKISSEVQTLYSRVNKIESDKIGWDVLFRIERSLALLSQQGIGNEAMNVVAQVVRQEIQGRQEIK